MGNAAKKEEGKLNSRKEQLVTFYAHLIGKRPIVSHFSTTTQLFGNSEHIFYKVNIIYIMGHI